MDRNKTSSSYWKRLVFGFLTTSLLLAACAKTPTPIPSVEPVTGAVDPVDPVSIVEPVKRSVDQSGPVMMVEPVTRVDQYEKYELRNCGSALTDLHEPMNANFQPKQEVVIADVATSLASGATYQLSATEKETVAALVAEAYQQKFTDAQAELEKQEFVAPKDRIATFDINWTAMIYSSTLAYDFRDEAYSVEYQYTLTIPEIKEKILHICGG